MARWRSDQQSDALNHLDRAVEAGRIAESTGIDLPNLRDALMLSSVKIQALEDWDQTTFTWALKDMQIVGGMTDATGLALPITGAVKELAKEARRIKATTRRLGRGGKGSRTRRAPRRTETKSRSPAALSPKMCGTVHKRDGWSSVRPGSRVFADEQSVLSTQMTNGNPMSDPAHLRAKAQLCSAIADLMTDPADANTARQTAEQYASLAEKAERERADQQGVAMRSAGKASG